MRRVVVLVVGLLVLQATPASAEPDAVKASMCSEGAWSRLELTHVEGLELTHVEGQIRMRFEVHQSPVGHEWRITFRNVKRNLFPVISRVIAARTRVASDSGVFVVQVLRPEWNDVIGVIGEAVDRQTGQVCKTRVPYGGA
jgi:hypothetical protein